MDPAEWAQLDLQSIQHCDYFGHLSISDPTEPVILEDFGHQSILDPTEPVILEVPQDEERSLAQWINNNLECDEDCSHLLPLESDGGDLYQKIGDGILLW